MLSYVKFGLNAGVPTFIKLTMKQDEVNRLSNLFNIWGPLPCYLPVLTAILEFGGTLDERPVAGKTILRKQVEKCQT